MKRESHLFKRKYSLTFQESYLQWEEMFPGKDAATPLLEGMIPRFLEIVPPREVTFPGKEATTPLREEMIPQFLCIVPSREETFPGEEEITPHGVVTFP